MPQRKGNIMGIYVFERHVDSADQKNVILAPLIDCYDPDRTVSWEPNIHSDSFNSAEQFSIHISYDVASGSEITPCNIIDKPLVVYRFSGNVITSITTLRT